MNEIVPRRRVMLFGTVVILNAIKKCLGSGLSDIIHIILNAFRRYIVPCQITTWDDYRRYAEIFTLPMIGHDIHEILAEHDNYHLWYKKVIYIDFNAVLLIAQEKIRRRARGVIARRYVTVQV